MRFLPVFPVLKARGELFIRCVRRHSEADGDVPATLHQSGRSSASLASSNKRDAAGAEGDFPRDLLADNGSLNRHQHVTCICEDSSRRSNIPFDAPIDPTMKSRNLANLWLCLLLLFAQHVTLAESVTAAQYANGDHQCALEECSTSDADISAHVGLDDLGYGVIALFNFLALSPASHVSTQTLVVEFFSVISPHYSTRAPPVT